MREGRVTVLRPVRSLSGSWTRVVPQTGASAEVALVDSQPGLTASVSVDGVVVATLRSPTRADPWVEVTLEDTDPPIAVVRVALPGRRQRSLLFADGVCVDDGLTLAEWRARRPGPIDDFEENIGASSWFGLPGAMAIGVAGFAGVISRGVGLTIILAAFGFLGLCFAWGLCVGRLVTWLTTKRSWPTGARSTLLVAVALGIPLLAFAMFQQLSVGHL